MGHFLNKSKNIKPRKSLTITELFGENKRQLKKSRPSFLQQIVFLRSRSTEICFAKPEEPHDKEQLADLDSWSVEKVVKITLSKENGKYISFLLQ